MRDRPPTVFISYSHKDRPWLERLDTYLAPVKREAQIKIWNDTQTPPGADWRREIETHLQTCDAAILIITAHFFASDFIDEQELPPLLDAAERRGVVILPLVAGHSCFQRSPLGRFQAGNDPAAPLESLSEPDRNAALNRFAFLVEDVVTALAAASAAPPAPPPDPDGTGPKLWLAPDDPTAFYANERFANACVETPRQAAATAGTPLSVMMFAGFGAVPGPGEPRLCEVELWVELPAGKRPTALLGRAVAHVCDSGVSLRLGSLGRPFWVLRRDREAGGLQGCNATAEIPPLFELPGAAAGDRVTARLVTYANRESFALPADDETAADGRKRSMAEKKVLKFLKERGIAEAGRNGELLLCRVGAEVRETDR